MRRIETLLIAFIVIAFFSMWWFWGRKPYIVLGEGFWSPNLVYVEPKWNGWDKRAIIFMKKVPPEFRESDPDAEGWWYVKTKIADIPDNYIKIDDPIEKSIEKLEKYYAWKPLGIIR